jgi:hypothetical protein
MAGRNWLLALAALGLLATGCAMCQSTYDYCGPVIGPEGQMCDFRARRGSILAEMPVQAADELDTPDPLAAGTWQHAGVSGRAAIPQQTRRSGPPELTAQRRLASRVTEARGNARVVRGQESMPRRQPAGPGK